MPRPVSPIDLSAEEEVVLQRRIRSGTTSQRENLRARIILLRSQGHKEQAVAGKLGVSLPCISKWSHRFELQGLAGLNDKPGRGRKPWLPAAKIEQVVTRVTQPPPHRRRWSVRSMARAVGISRHSVHKIWKQNELKPHLTRVFKVSTDPDLERKFWDVIGLYLHPPDKALVLCCDEKSQCQALERSQPALPLGIGHIRTQTHDYFRQGTITLFAALNYLEGKIISRTEAQHTHVEWLRFLKQIDRETPAGLDLHLIVDNYGTHKHARVQQWLNRRPRFHLHFTPTGSSWLNLVERFFAELTEDAIRAGSLGSVGELVRAIEQYLTYWRENPKRYTWHAKGEDILAKIQRAREALRHIK